MSTMASRITAFLDSQENAHIAASTLNQYRSILEGVVVPFCETREIATPQGLCDALGDLCGDLETQKRAGSTIANYLVSTKKFLRHSGCECDFVYRIKAEDKKKSQKKAVERFFDEADIARCMNYESPRNTQRNRLIVRLFIETGMRVDELAELKVVNIGVETNTLFIDHSKTRMRYVPVSQETAFLIEQEIARRKKSSPLLFPISTSSIQKVVTSMLESLGMKNGADGRGPHTFRHWAATEMVFVHGMDIEHVAYLLGDTPDVIRSEYLHPTPKMIAELARKARGVDW